MQRIRRQHRRPHGLTSRRAGAARGAAFALAALLAVAGCAAVRERGPRLLGDPSEGSLLLVDGTLTAEYNQGSMTEYFDKVLQTGTARLPQHDTLEDVAIERRDAPGRLIYGTMFGGAVLFPRLAAGDYELRSMGHGRILIEHLDGADLYLAKREFRFGVGTGNQLTFTVDQGSLGYVGGIDVVARYEGAYDRDGRAAVGGTAIDLTGSDTEWRARVGYDPAREREAWAKLLRLAEGTAWGPFLQARLDELDRATPADSAGAAR